MRVARFYRHRTTRELFYPGTFRDPLSLPKEIEAVDLPESEWPQATPSPVPQPTIIVVGDPSIIAKEGEDAHERQQLRDRLERQRQSDADARAVLQSSRGDEEQPRLQDDARAVQQQLGNETQQPGETALSGRRDAAGGLNNGLRQLRTPDDGSSAPQTEAARPTALGGEAANSDGASGGQQRTEQAGSGVAAQPVAQVSSDPSNPFALPTI